MKILHVASFIGNIGDNASHAGLTAILKIIFNEYEIEQLEIRKFYKNYQLDDARVFDEEFIEYANSFDLLIIGGGGFLDYWVEGSATGTTIDLDPELVPCITVPTLMMSVGCVPHRKIPEGNIDKFIRFIQAVNKNPNIRIAVRNDGSIETLKNILSPDEMKCIPEIMDNGFFYKSEEGPSFIDGDYIAINITLDQIGMNSSLRGAIDLKAYQEEIVKVVNHIAVDLDKHVVFVPHIFSDIKAICDVLKNIEDFVVRSKVSIAPYVQGDAGSSYLFNVYKNSLLVLATRFHANVCPMSMGVPVIGLVALDRVKYIYDAFESSDGYVVLDGCFSSELNNKIDECIKNPAIFLGYKDSMDFKKVNGLDVLKAVFSELGLSYD